MPSKPAPVPWGAVSFNSMEVRPVLLLECDDVLVETRSARLSALRAALAHDSVTITDEKYDLVCTGVSNAAAVRAACAG